MSRNIGNIFKNCPKTKKRHKIRDTNHLHCSKEMKSIPPGIKVSKVVDKLLRMYANPPHRRCSGRYLARLINPEQPPNNAVNQWLRCERGLYEDNIARIAPLLGVSPAALFEYLNNNPDYERLLDYTEADVIFCEGVIQKLISGEPVPPEDKADMEEVMLIVDTMRLAELIKMIDKEVSQLIEDPRTKLAVSLRDSVSDQILKKLNLLSGQENLVR
jgi:predicted transcriptional regulator